MITAAAYRGQPVVALAVILGGWIAIRVTMWAVMGPTTFVETDAPKQVAAAGRPERPNHTAAPDSKGPPESTNRAIDAALSSGVVAHAASDASARQAPCASCVRSDGYGRTTEARTGAPISQTQRIAPVDVDGGGIAFAVAGYA